MEILSALAKLTNLWREHSRAIFRSASAHPSPEINLAWALANAKSVVPQCIAGRWGSVTAVEDRILAAGVPQLRMVMVGVLDKKAKATPGAAGADSGLDAVQIEQQQAYRVRLGRWAKETLDTLADPTFELVLKISRIAHEPHVHFTRVCNTAQSQAQQDANGGGIIVQLATGKATEILTEYSQAYENSAWAQLVDDDSSSLAALLVLHQASDFYRRICEPLAQYFAD